MNAIWEERFAQDGYLFGTEPYNKNISQIIKILKKKLSKNGIICFVDIVSKREKQEVGWRFRTVNYYKNLFNGYSINSDYYFFEDGQKKVFFLVSKN